MIDIHTHILPYLDDGADNWADALEMARMAVESGVTAIAATPHCGEPNHPRQGRREQVRLQLAELRERLEQEKIPLTVYEGMEIFGTEETVSLLRTGLLATLNDSRYPLVEFPFEHYARQGTRILEQLLVQGYRPVVAHPERYRYVQSDPTLLNLWVDMGCLLQINRGSLLGRFGATAEELSWALLGRRFVCTVSSDAHSPVMRTPWMRDVEELLQEEFSEQTARRLLEDNPARLLADRSIKMPEPIWF